MLRQLRRHGMPTQIVADGSIRKRYNRALRLEPDYVLVVSGSQDDTVLAQFKIRRRISDRYKTKGAVFRALRPLLKNQFGVEPEELRQIVDHGGELRLVRNVR